MIENYLKILKIVNVFFFPFIKVCLPRQDEKRLVFSGLPRTTTFSSVENGTK